MKTITFGRDHQTNLLRISVDGKCQTFKQLGEVPKSVSLEHASLTIGDDGELTLRNLNIENDTSVNGVGIEQKRIKQGDLIVLGTNRFRLPWDIIEPFIPKMADISPLEQVWKNYQEGRLQMQIKERRFNTLRSATGLITMFAMVLGAFTGRDNPVFMALYIAAAVISLGFFFMAYRASSKLPMQQNQLAEEAKRQYKCPACGSLLTLQDYDLLRQSKGCPHCGAKWKK